jgi:hypothetical protein
MGIDLTGIGAATTAIKGIVDKFLPDKTEAEKESFQLELESLTSQAAAAQAQAAIDQAEASSPDRINHWRGGLGWMLVAAMGWQFIGAPIVGYVCAIAHVTAALPVFPVDALYPLLFAMLGVTGAHVYQQVKS